MASIVFYNTFRKYDKDGTFDLDSNTLTAVLTTSSYTPALTHNKIADVTNILTPGVNGYNPITTVLSSSNWGVTTGATIEFKMPSWAWTAAGGTITARYLILYNAATVNGIVGPLIGYIDIGAQSVTTGNTLTVAPYNGVLWFNT